MADSKISALPSATTPLAGTELLPIVQGGATAKVAVSAFQAPLVSGTNIKTLNGNSLLGSGDLAISGGSGSPGGSTTQVQFNDAGAFGGNAGLVFDKASGKLTVGGPAQAGGFQLSSSGIITDATASRTLTASDNGKVIYFTSASAVAVTTSSGLGAGFYCTLVQGGTGRITVSAGAGTSVVSYGSFTKTAGQYAALSAMCPVSDTFYLNGDLG